VLYGKVGEKNFKGIVDGVDRFCGVEPAEALGYRVAAILRVSCDAADKQIYDFDTAIYLGDRLNNGRVVTVIRRCM
jgi:hypothetical protein